MISIEVDNASLNKVLTDLSRNLGRAATKKVLAKGSRASAKVYRKAIKASAASVGLPPSMKVRYKAIPYKNKNLVGHSIFVGTSANLMHTSEFQVPAIWIEFGTYNQRTRMYMASTVRRHPRVLNYASLYPPGYGIRPRPFIRPAVLRNEGAARAAFSQAVQEAAKNFKVSK